MQKREFPSWCYFISDKSYWLPKMLKNTAKIDSFVMIKHNKKGVKRCILLYCKI